jgi:hypothetical protein
MEGVATMRTTEALTSSVRPATPTSIPRRLRSCCYRTMLSFSPPASLMTTGSTGNDPGLIVRSDDEAASFEMERQSRDTQTD